MSEITFSQLASNPVGKGSAQVGKRAVIIADLRKRVMHMHNSLKGMEMTVYKTDDGVFVIFFRILSETVRNMWYDTILTLTPPKEGTNGKTVGEYTCRFASNMMSFAYSYLYVANQMGYFFTPFKDKFPSIFFTDKPEIRNPSLSFGFEKAILFPVYFMYEKKFHYIDKLDSLSKGKPNLVILSKKFMSFTKKEEEYRKMKAKHKAEDIKAGLRNVKTSSGKVVTKRIKKPIQAKSSLRSKSAIKPKRPK